MMKSLNQLVLASVLIFFTGVILVESINPQPTPKTKLQDKQLPPEVFPKEDSNGSIRHHLQGELPPEIFPDDKALAKLHAGLKTKVISKTDLNNESNTKVTQHDTESTNKTSSISKVMKVASEIPDLLKTDYVNITTYDDTPSINNDTETVKGPNVINDNKTHDEDASNIQANCSVTETSEQDNSTLKNECITDTAIKNDTIEEHHNEKNDSLTHMLIESTTEPEVNQTSTLNITTEDEFEATTYSNNLTTSEDYENVTNKAEINSSTVEYNATISSTVVTVSENNNATVELQSESTLMDNSTAPATSTGSTVTELSTTKLETSSVNISENIIDHRNGSPVALATSQKHAEHSHGSSGKSSPFLQPTESAAILAGVFVGIALLGYVGLLVWRRILEKRYGNREMLVNEDDFYDTNDLRNFEL